MLRSSRLYLFYKRSVNISRQLLRWLEKCLWFLVEDISFFSPLRFLILIDSTLMDLVVELRGFIFKLFTKEQSNSLEFSGILSLLSMICFSCLSLLERLEISYYHLLLASLFSMFFSYHFRLGSNNGWSNQFWCSQEFF